MNGSSWLSVPDAADVLGVTPRTVYRLIARGEVPDHRPRGFIRLRREEVEAYLHDVRIDPGSLPPGTDPSSSDRAVRGTVDQPEA